MGGSLEDVWRRFEWGWISGLILHRLYSGCLVRRVLGSGTFGDRWEAAGQISHNIKSHV